MTNPHPSHEDHPGDDEAFRLERYADARMPPDEAALFERELERDPDLQRGLAAARALDARLKHLFTPPPAPPAPLPHRASAPSIPWWQRPIDRRWALAAAVLILASLLAVEFWPVHRPILPRITLAELYREEVANGFTPYTVCTTPEAFALWTRQELGATLLPGTLAPGVVLLGWNYRTVAPGYSGLLLARVNGTNVLLLLSHVPTPASNPPAVPHEDPLAMDHGDHELHVFRRGLGPINVLEITPLDAPAVMGTLELAPAG